MIIPRRSRIEELGLATLVLQLKFDQGMGPTAIAEKLLDMGHGVITVEQIRNFLNGAPEDLVEKAEEVGLTNQLKPLLDYAQKVEKTTIEVEQVKDRMLAHFDSVMAMPDSEAMKALDFLREKGLTDAEIQKTVKAVKRLYVAPFYFTAFRDMLGELRKMMAFAAKIDKTPLGQQPAPTGPVKQVFIQGDVNVLRPNDMVDIFQQAKKGTKVLDTEKSASTG